MPRRGICVVVRIKQREESSIALAIFAIAAQAMVYAPVFFASLMSKPKPAEPTDCWELKQIDGKYFRFNHCNGTLEAVAISSAGTKAPEATSKPAPEATSKPASEAAPAKPALEAATTPAQKSESSK